MPFLESFLQLQLWGNAVYDYLLALCIFLVFYLGLVVLDWFIEARLKKFAFFSSLKFANFFVTRLKDTVFPVLYATALYFSISQLRISPSFLSGLRMLWMIYASIQLTRFLLDVITFSLEQVWLVRRQDKAQHSVLQSILSLVKIVIWGVVVVFILDNLGFNVSAVVAGLGIGGIAMALAAQTILGDLFNYFVIFFDRPFEEGDFIIFDDFMGEIENIGIKSTRIRALDGEQIVISNSNLTNARIRNYKRMSQRRVLFKFGIVYETSLEKVKKIPSLITGIIQSLKNVRFDRVHFHQFGDFSLNYEVVYYVLDADYNAYMDIQQQINLAILEAFQKEGIEFAYPTSVQYHRT